MDCDQSSLYSTTTFNSMAFNQSIQDDDETDINAIFAAGMVVTEARTGRIVASAPRDSKPQILSMAKPLAFKDSLVKRSQLVSENFSNNKTKTDFLIEQTKKQGEFTHMAAKLKHDVKINILEHIDSKFVKEHPVSMTICGKQFLIPRINVHSIEDVSSGLKIYQGMLLSNLAASLELVGKRLKPEPTINSLHDLLLHRAELVSKRSPRKEVTLQLLTVIVLELAANHSQKQAIEALATVPFIEDTTTGGCFVPLNSVYQDHTTRATTMIQECAIGTSLDVVYNFTLRQVRSLLTYILDSDPRLRLEAKINLLSSLKDNVRSDTALNPSHVLHRACAELYLSRYEILLLIFQDDKSNTRCPNCKRTVTLTETSLTHTSCQILEWLTTEFDLQLTPTGIRIPSIAYMQPSLSQFARELIRMDSIIKQTPLISKTQDETVIYKLDSSSVPHKILSQGTKTVKLHSNPNTKT